MAASSSITLAQTLEWAKRFNFNRAANVGNGVEPAITSANTVLQTIVGAPFAWRWNRYIIGFITNPGQQDYTLFNYLPSTAVKAGWFTIDDAGFCQKCITGGTTGASAPTWNHVVTGSTPDGTAVWINMGLVTPEASGTYSFAWVENSSIQDTVQGSPSWKELTSKIVLGLESGQGRPTYVSAQIDDGLGNITFRLLATPDKAYPVSLTVQGKPPLFTSLRQTWNPIPDEYAHIYNWGFLSFMWLFADDPRFPTANSKFIASLLSTTQGLTQTQLNIFLQNWQSITGQPMSNQIAQTQGAQARGA